MSLHQNTAIPNWKAGDPIIIDKNKLTYRVGWGKIYKLIKYNAWYIEADMVFEDSPGEFTRALYFLPNSSILPYCRQLTL